MLGVADAFDQAWLRDAAASTPIAVSAPSIARSRRRNAAMLGLSRLGYSLAVNRQIPSAVGRAAPDARDARAW